MLLLHRRRALAGGTAAAAWAKQVADAEGRWFLVAQLVSEALLPLPHRPASTATAPRARTWRAATGFAAGWPRTAPQPFQKVPTTARHTPHSEASPQPPPAAAASAAAAAAAAAAGCKKRNLCGHTLCCFPTRSLLLHVLGGLRLPASLRQRVLQVRPAVTGMRGRRRHAP